MEAFRRIVNIEVLTSRTAPTRASVARIGTAARRICAFVKAAEEETWMGAAGLDVECATAEGVGMRYHLLARSRNRGEKLVLKSMLK